MTRFLTLSVLALLAGGCAVAALGAAGAATWSAVAPDTVETTLERPYDEAFEIAVRTITNWQGGPPKVIDKEAYFLFADYDGTEVTVGFRIEPPTTIVRIKARSGYGAFPSRGTAEDLASGMYEEAKRY